MGQVTLNANCKVSQANTELPIIFCSLTNKYLANTLSNSSDTFSWVASCDPDCNAPYELHIVNSRGSSYEVTQEGFWSDYFWIRASSPPGTTSTTTSAKSTTTAPLAISSAPSTTSTQAPPITSTSGTVSPSPSPAETKSNGLSTGVTVGISIGAGAIVLCTIGLGVFYCAFRNRREKVLRNTMPHESYDGDNKGLPTYFAMTSRERGAVSPQHVHPRSASGQKLVALDTTQSMNHTPTELAATQSPSELGTTR